MHTSLGIDIVKIAEITDQMAKDGKTPCQTVCSFLSHRPGDAPTLSPESRSRWQRLFAQYLNVLAVILEGADDMSLIKLLNEVCAWENDKCGKVFVGSELWQDIVNMFVIQLFTLSAHGEQDGGCRFTLQDVDDIYLSSLADPTGSGRLREDIFATVIDTLRTLRYHTAMCHMLQTAVRVENIFKKKCGESDTQRYWKSSIRKTLQNVMYILKPVNGVLAKYIAANGCATRLAQSQGLSPDVCEEQYSALQ